MAGSAHRWQFSRLGGFDQARFETAADLADLENLDLKLWVALACPVKGIEFDERTLALIDTDHDGRVRAPELIAAADWAGKMLADWSVLAHGRDSLPLAAIDDSHDEGKRLRATAEAVLASIDKPEAKSISVAD